MKKPKPIFKDGPISAQFIGESIAKHQTKTDIGAHEIFLGQVRADIIGDKEVSAIHYTAYEEMAGEKAHALRESAFDKFDLTCMHIYHSLGEVKTGEICFFIFVSSPHRMACREALSYLVDAFKSEIPVFGKEIFNDASHQWKVNK